jgi:hypothetical protein
MKGRPLSILISPLRITFLDYSGGQADESIKRHPLEKGIDKKKLPAYTPATRRKAFLCRFSVRITGATCTLWAIRAVPPVPSFYKEKAKEISGPEQASRPLFICSMVV